MLVDYEKIGTRIKTERERLGYSKEAFAAILGIKTRAKIGEWERGESVPPVEIIAKMCEKAITIKDVCGSQPLRKYYRKPTKAVTISGKDATFLLFDCEMGYLLGEFDQKTREASDICRITGLSGTTVAELADREKLIKSGDHEPSTMLMRIIDSIVEDSQFCEMLGEYITNTQIYDHLFKDNVSEWANKARSKYRELTANTPFFMDVFGIGGSDAHNAVEIMAYLQSDEMTSIAPKPPKSVSKEDRDFFPLEQGFIWIDLNGWVFPFAPEDMLMLFNFHRRRNEIEYILQRRFFERIKAAEL